MIWLINSVKKSTNMLKKEKYNDSLPKIKLKKWTPEGHHPILRVYVHVCARGQ